MKLKAFLLIPTLCLASSLLSYGEDVEIKLAEAPSAVQKALKKYAGSNRVLKVEKAKDDEETLYEVLTAKENGKEIEYIFKTNGSLDSTEEVLELDELSADVKATALETVGNGKIKEIEKVTEDGKVTYEIGYKSDSDEKKEAVIDAKGKLMKNSRETD